MPMNSLKVSVSCFFVLSLSAFIFACSRLPAVNVEQIYLTDFSVQGDVIKTKVNLIFVNEGKSSFSFRIASVSATLDGKKLPMQIDDGWQDVKAKAKSHVKLNATMKGGQLVLERSLQQGLKAFLTNDPFVLEFNSKLHIRKGGLITKVNLKRSFQFTLNDLNPNAKGLR